MDTLVVEVAMEPNDQNQSQESRPPSSLPLDSPSSSSRMTEDEEQVKEDLPPSLVVESYRPLDPEVDSLVFAPMYFNEHVHSYPWIEAKIIDVSVEGEGKKGNKRKKKMKNKWTPGEKKYKVQYCDENFPVTTSRIVSAKELAQQSPCNFNRDIGTRVLAKFRDGVDLDAPSKDFFIGVVAEIPNADNKFRYLIFFDDGDAQYVKKEDVRRVYKASSQVDKDVLPKMADFIKEYVAQPDVPRLAVGINQVFNVIWKDGVFKARVIQVDASLVKILYEDDDEECRSEEWVFRSSHRLTVKLPEEGGIIIKRKIPPGTPTPKNFQSHFCKVRCLSTDEDNDNYLSRFEMLSPLALPLCLGFSREAINQAVYYLGPCGHILVNMEQVYDYLQTTKCPSKIQIDNFCFDQDINFCNEFIPSDPKASMPDLSNGKEKVPIQVVNSIDNSDMVFDFEYHKQSVDGEGVPEHTDDEFLCGCDCEDDCRDSQKCRCIQTTLSGMVANGGQSAYEYRRLMRRIESGLYECNDKCKCSKTCGNRVVQHGLKYPLQLFRTTTKGWGVRTLVDIPMGTFICEYVGEILTDENATEKESPMYQAELNLLEEEVTEKEGYESDVPEIVNEELEEDVNKTNLKTKKRKKRVSRRKQLFGRGERCYVVDAKEKGNIGRFLNHSCSPNTFAQSVFVDTHDLRFPVVAIFTNSRIFAGTELTWDYGYKVGLSEHTLYCCCGSRDCRKRLL